MTAPLDLSKNHLKAVADISSLPLLRTPIPSIASGSESLQESDCKTQAATAANAGRFASLEFGRGRSEIAAEAADAVFFDRRTLRWLIVIA
jgi:hypothetical protein